MKMPASRKQYIELNLLKSEGGKNMKKMLKSKKGFSLIELLIVLAILAIIAAIAINMFGGLIGNTRQKADQQTAKTLKKAITAYIAASGDKLLYQGADAASDYSTSIDTLIANLQNGIEITSTDVAVTAHGAMAGNYGPYLENPNPGSTGTAANYLPKWNAEYTDNPYLGWTVNIYEDTGNVVVEPSIAASSNVVFK